MSGNAHIVDRQINRVFKMSNRNSYRATHQLLGWIQETVGVRTIGFYLKDGRGRDIVWEAQNFCNTKTDAYGEQAEKQKKEFNKLSTSFTDGSYDLAILINQKKLKLNAYFRKLKKKKIR